MITMYFEAGSLEVYPINASSTATFLARALMLTAPLAASCLVRFFFLMAFASSLNLYFR